MKNNLILCFLVISGVSFSQEKMIHGKIVDEGNFVGGINLVNLVNEKSAVTDANGEFYILAKAEDMLIFSAINIEYKRKIIEEEDLKKDILIIQVTSKATQLEEVVVTKYSNITAYKLGIVSREPREFTVGERRMLSHVGSKAERKARVEHEKKERLIQKLDKFFDEEYFTEKLKIEKEYVLDFKCYCCEQADFIAIINTNIKADITSGIIQLAEKYNSLQLSETLED